MRYFILLLILIGFTGTAFAQYVGNTTDQNLGQSQTMKFSEDNIPPPLKQFKSGIPIDAIQCKDNLQLVIKTKDMSPSCVQPRSIARLLLQGWSVADNGLTITLSAGQRAGSLLVKDIFSDHVSGLNFMDYPVAREDGFPVTLRIGESASNGCTVELTLLKISGNTATFLKKEYNNRPCPICLSGNTVIDTPNGPVNIKELKKGMTLFTQDASGNRTIGTVLETGKTMVLPSHKMIHLVLDDNRSLYGSPNHPTADGRHLGDLKVGNTLDGVKIRMVELVSYNDTHTYDLLPSGQTGFYWANGILIDSTMK